MMAGTAIRMLGVVKRFGHFTALRGIDLTVDEGESVALLGANGAGKSTLLRIAATLARPSSGSIFIGDVDAAKDPEVARASIGLLSHQSFLYEDLTAGENLAFYATLYGVADPRGAALAALEGVNLAARSNDRFRTFSRGMRQRMAIARALLHDPSILLLDEPFAGLDVRSRDTLIDRIQKSRTEKRIIVLVTHDIALGLRLADRFVLLETGRVIETGVSGEADPSELESRITIPTEPERVA